ncbi:hypothetical protein YC2023_094923 [Brassica napus]
MDKSGGKKVMNEIRSFQKANLFDLGHPLINRIADSFVKASGAADLALESSELMFTSERLYVGMIADPMRCPVILSPDGVHLLRDALRACSMGNGVQKYDVMGHWLL